MKNGETLSIQLDAEGHLILPAELLARYGLQPGEKIRLTEDAGGFHISRSPNCLRRVYIEPTNACNLDCRTCMRNVWDEPLGMMSKLTFQGILDGLQTFSPLPSVFFGGYGEPLAHPQISEMIAAAHHLGVETELITNGTLLDEPVARRIMEAGLDRLWVSLDGATPEGYSDVRLGAALPQVIANLSRLHEMRERSLRRMPKLGIAFVAMKRNIAELPAVIRLGNSLGADRFSISNVLPHTAELQEQVLYGKTMSDINLQPSVWSPVVSLPRIDLEQDVIEAISEVLKGRNSIELSGQPLAGGASTCPFLVKGSVSVRWDGEVSPCLPLLHTHQSYLEDTLRTTHAHSFGNIHNMGLAEIWQYPEYVRLRERLLEFDFSPCVLCNSCTMAKSNLEDCFGNSQPTCGGCLWGQGFIQCP